MGLLSAFFRRFQSFFEILKCRFACLKRFMVLVEMMAIFLKYFMVSIKIEFVWFLWFSGWINFIGGIL